MLPIILILLVGMLEFGMAYNDLLTVGYASREGARAGSALAKGGATSCTPSTDPGGVDKTVIAAVQRIVKSPGSDVEIQDIQQIRIYKATSTGAQSGSAREHLDVHARHRPGCRSRAQAPSSSTSARPATAGTSVRG